MSLTARHLEENGIPTVILGSARDIVEHCAVPRFVFSDVPLGNPVGPPNDAATQRANVELALSVLEEARFPQTTVRSPHRWTQDDWRASYLRVDDSNRDELARLGAERRRERQADRDAGRGRPD